MINYAAEVTEGKRVVVRLPVPECTIHRGREVMAVGEGDNWSHYACNQEAGAMDAGVQPLLFMKTETLAHRMGPSTLRVSFPASINPIYSSPRTYQEACCHANSRSGQIDRVNHHTARVSFFLSLSSWKTGIPAKLSIYVLDSYVLAVCLSVSEHLFSLVPAFLGGEIECATVV